MKSVVDPALTENITEDRNHGLGPVLRELRKGAGKTHADVAAPMGLGRTSLCNIERGNQAITVEKLVAFADHLDIEVTISFRPKKRGRKFAAVTTDIVLGSRSDA